MLSICIPIYNFDVRHLVNALGKQIALLDVDAELILIDDCSTPNFKEINDCLCNGYTYIELEKNVGRSKIRNLFLDYIQYDYLLFLDCDATIISDTFLRKYTDFIQSQDVKVICGGSSYPIARVPRTHHLRWLNGNKRETRSAQLRRQNPYGSFMTSNVIIHRSVFNRVTFDESLVKYGHEDTLFGFELHQHKIAISHLDNYVLNDDLDTNKAFVEKSESALTNLYLIAKQLQFNESFVHSLKILKFYKWLSDHRLLKPLQLIFPLFKSILKRFLISGYASLLVFDLYKIGVLSLCEKKKIT